MNNWKKTTLGEVVLFNPTERIAKGTIAKKIAMDKIQSFTRMISGYELTEFSGGSKFRNGDTLLARITPCLENGKTAQVTILDNDEIGFGSTEYIVLREKENITDNNYIYYFSLNPSFRNVAIQSMVGSSGRQRVQQNVLENLEINLPPLDEQRRIADVLSALDDKIEVNNKINDNLEAQAQAIFKQWFVDFEFPGFDGEMVNGLPKGWKIEKFSTLCNVKYGKDHKHLNDGNIPVYGSGGIMRYAERALYEDESILIPRKGTLGNLFYVMEPFWSVDTMFYTMINKPNIRKYLFYFLKTLNLASMNVGSAVPSLTTEVLNKLDIIVPERQILQEFENFVSILFSKMNENKRQIQLLNETRDTILPKLMSGEIRV